MNKHTESIAKAIQVPHRPQQIQICNNYFSALFNMEQLESLRQLSLFLFNYEVWNTSCGRKKSSIKKYESIAKNSPETNFEQRAITHEKVGELWRKSNLIWNSSNWSLLQGFIHKYESIAEKSPENKIWTKGNNSWKGRSTMTKVELDL